MPAPISHNSNYDNYAMTDMDNQNAAASADNDDSAVSGQGVKTDSATTGGSPEKNVQANIEATKNAEVNNTTSAVDGTSITADNGNINMQYEKDDGSTTDVVIGKDKVTFTDSSPESEEPVVQEIKYGHIQDISPEQVAKLDELSAALRPTEGSDIGGQEGKLLENAKARIKTVQDPNFLQQVNERMASDEFKTTDLFNGDRVLVTEEYDLTAESNGSFSVFNPGDGYTTRNINLTDDGTAVTFGKNKGDESPIYTDENGQLKVVLGHEKVTDEQLRDKAVTELMTEQIKGSVIRALPVETTDGQTSINNLAAGETDDQVTFGYDRSEGAMDQVQLGNNGINIQTTVPGATAADNRTVELEIKYADMNDWSSTDQAMVDDVRNALQNADTSQFTEAQKIMHTQAMAKLDALQDPLFWNNVNTKVAEQVNGEVNGEPAVINEEFRLIETTHLSDKGAEKEFFIDRGNGREKVEINDDETVTLGDEQLPVRLDQQTGDWYVVTDHETAENLLGRVTAQHMKVRGDQAAEGTSNPLSTMAQMPNPMAYQVDEPADKYQH